MNRKLKKSLMLALTVILLSSTTLFAQGKKERERKEESKEMNIEKKSENSNGEESFGINDLNEDQKQKIKKLRIAHKKEMMQTKNQMAEKKARLKTLETADVADMNSINKTIEEMGALKTEQMKKKAAHRQEIRKLLHEEQRLEFDLKHQKDENHGKEKHKRKRMRGDDHEMEMEKNMEIKIIKENDND